MTGLRAVDSDAPSGEWELHLAWATGSEHIGDEDGSACAGRKGERSVFTRARDMAVGEDMGESSVEVVPNAWLVRAAMWFYEAVQKVAL